MNKSDSSQTTASSQSEIQEKCAICLTVVTAGRGQAMFVAECGHSFHFNCIVSSVSYGNKLCPICRNEWHDLPAISPNPNAPVLLYSEPSFGNLPYQLSSLIEPSFENQLSSLSLFPNPSSTLETYDQSPLREITLQSDTEYPALSSSESTTSFAVLIRTIAPPLNNEGSQQRAPIDLVLVLDVSGSMSGGKLSLLKQAVVFVIENLGPRDRLSIVSFTTTARLIFPLQMMCSSSAKESGIAAVNSLRADGGTDIYAGLRRGFQVLNERVDANPVESIMLLSDGQNNSNSVEEVNNGGGCPVHTFGFGVDHDAALLHRLSDSADGTFSFIESIDIVREAFARCIGGLLSVVAQDVRIVMRSASSDVRIVSIPSGRRYRSQISSEGTEGVINAGMFYAEEEKQFLVYLSFSNDQGTGEEDTKLLDLRCEYKILIPNPEDITVEAETVKIQRPRVLSPEDKNASASAIVHREKNRLLMVQDIEQARLMAESGNLQGARQLLDRRLLLLRAESERFGVSFDYASLENEIVEIVTRMRSMEEYRHTGRSYALSGLSSHVTQRATTRGIATPASVQFSTQSMSDMVRRSSGGI